MPWSQMFEMKDAIFDSFDPGRFCDILEDDIRQIRSPLVFILPPHPPKPVPQFDLNKFYRT